MARVSRVLQKPVRRVLGSVARIEHERIVVLVEGLGGYRMLSATEGATHMGRVPFVVDALVDATLVSVHAGSELLIGLRVAKLRQRGREPGDVDTRRRRQFLGVRQRVVVA